MQGYADQKCKLYGLMIYPSSIRFFQAVLVNGLPLIPIRIRGGSLNWVIMIGSGSFPVAGAVADPWTPPSRLSSPRTPFCVAPESIQMDVLQKSSQRTIPVPLTSSAASITLTPLSPPTSPSFRSRYPNTFLSFNEGINPFYSHTLANLKTLRHRYRISSDLDSLRAAGPPNSTTKCEVDLTTQTGVLGVL